MWSEVAHFYGWTFGDIRAMRLDEFAAARQYLADTAARESGQ